MPSPLAVQSPDVWVGPQYSAGFGGRRLLIVGEAKPDAQDKIRIGRGLEATLTGQYVDGDIKHQTFTDLARLCLGKPAPRQRCEEFFRQIAFANLSLRNEAKTSDENATLHQDFARLLLELQPSVVLVLGAEVTRVLSEDTFKETLAPAAFTLLYAPHPGTPGFSFRDHVGATALLRSRKKAPAAR